MNADDMIEFVTDPLRLTLIVAGIVVIFAILILGRRSKHREVAYKGRPEKNYSFGASPADMLVDEEVIVLPRRKKESEVIAEKTPHFSANYDGAAERKDDFSADKSQTPVAPSFQASAANVDAAKVDAAKVGNTKAKTIKATSTKGPRVIDDAISLLYSDPVLPEFESVSKVAKAAPNAPAINTIERALETAPEQIGEKRPELSKHELNKSELNRQEPNKVQEQPQAEVQVSQPAKQVKQQFVVLHILAEEGQSFVGKAIFDATQTLGMALGKHNVFHYPADAAYVGDSAFCLVNMTPEGTFDIENLANTHTAGISLILTLPTAYSDGLTVFSNMVAVAHALVKKLGGGDIVDQTRLPLTAELVANMQSDITKFEDQMQVETPVH